MKLNLSMKNTLYNTLVKQPRAMEPHNDSN